jgi:hypothetical protein
MLQVPGWLKALYDWTKIVGLFVGAAAFVLGFLFGHDKGLIIASLIATFAIGFFLVILVVGNAFAAVGEASSAVSDYDKWTPEKRRQVLDGMKASKNAVIFWTIVFALVAVVAVALLLFQPVYHRLYTKIPDKIEFAKIAYFDASQQRLVEESPIVEAIVTSLKDEAQASGMNARVIVGTTKPFERPTPAFRFRVVIKDDNFQLSAYAFLTGGTGSGTVYQSVLPNYTEKNAVILSVPASETGEKVFFVGRLSLAPGKSDFPSDPETILGATTMTGENHS